MFNESKFPGDDSEPNLGEETLIENLGEKAKIEQAIEAAQAELVVTTENVRLKADQVQELEGQEPKKGWGKGVSRAFDKLEKIGGRALTEIGGFVAGAAGGAFVGTVMPGETSFKRVALMAALGAASEVALRIKNLFSDKKNSKSSKAEVAGQ